MGKDDAVKDWVTSSGLRAVIVKNGLGSLCGYVGLLPGHLLYAVGYTDDTPVLNSAMQIVLQQKIGKRSPMTTMFGARPTIELVFDVHGSVTYSGGGKGSKYPVESDLWWIGFDCGHFDDSPAKCDVNFVTSECESLAKQLAAVVDKFKETDR